MDSGLKAEIAALRSGVKVFTLAVLYSLHYNFKVAAILMQGAALRWTSILFRGERGGEKYPQSLHANENVDKSCACLMGL